MAAKVLTALFLGALSAPAFAEKAGSEAKDRPSPPAVKGALSDPLILSLVKRGQSAAAEDDDEERKTEMALRNPLEASEKCCNRYDRGGEAHNGWPPQRIAAFLKGDDRPSGSEAAPSSSGAASGSGSQ